MNTQLTIQEIWNKKAEIELGQINSPKSRNYISPSDIGKSFIDRYYKMKGEPPTNPYDKRVLRIFDAGRLFEWIVGRALTMAGILKDKQIKINIPETNDHLSIYGYCDYLIGGIVDWSMAEERIKKWLSEYKLNENDEILEKYALKLINGLREKYGDQPIEEIPIEVKSVNSLSFWGHNNRDEAGNFLGYDWHKFQLLAYMIGLDKQVGRLFYISKDDLCLQEVAVFRNTEIEEKFWEDVKTMSNYFRNNIVPPKEPEIVYNERTKRFELNWEVGRSIYLTKIYGYKDKVEFEEKNKSKLNEINRALKHLREFHQRIDEKKRETLIKKISAEQEIINAYRLNNYI